MTEYENWLQQKLDAEIYEELIAVKDSPAEIEDRFFKALSFGTGGLRGVIGAGTNRMNRYTVGKATFGLGDYLLSAYPDSPISVVIAYDSRCKSPFFARVAAEVLSSQGITAYLFSELTPTPVLSFAVRQLKAQAGIVITASHNPKEYNGYKVYNEHGCQLTDDAANSVTERIEKFDYFTAYTPDESKICVLNDDIMNAFLAEIRKCSLAEIDPSCVPSIVYTPLHGTGMRYVKEILAQIGATEVHVVKEQEDPDETFTTCPYPNPEEKAALALALRDAEKYNADLVLATDPDADRVGIAVKDDNGEFCLLNGNETGSILLHYILSRKKETGTLGANPTVIKTIVTSDLIYAIAKDYGANVMDVLTGFKYIGEGMDTLDNYVLGLEESYGYLVGTHARDKDAVSAVMLIVEACAYFKSQGKSLYQVLQYLYNTYGFYRTELISMSLPGKDGMQKMADIINAIRKDPKFEFGGETFAFTDFKYGDTGLPKSNVLRFLSKNYRVIIRPSGTEPKLKIYFQVNAKDEATAISVTADLKNYVTNDLLK